MDYAPAYRDTVQLEPVFLMSVIPFLRNLETLLDFHQVARVCDDAIGRIKINPSYSERGIETLLRQNRQKNIAKELRVFTGLETCHVDFNTIERLPPGALDRVRLVEVPFFATKTDPEAYRTLYQLRGKIASYGVDPAFKEDIDFTACVSMREFRIRVGRTVPTETVETVVRQIAQLKHLRRVVVSCDTQFVDFFWRIFQKYDFFRPRIIFKLNWFRDDDAQKILKVKDAISYVQNHTN